MGVAGKGKGGDAVGEEEEGAGGLNGVVWGTIQSRDVR